MKFSSKPSITRIEPGIAARGSALPGLSAHHRVVWSGFVVPPESGSYRLGLSGSNGELWFEGKLLSARKPGSWGTPTEIFDGVAEERTALCHPGHHGSSRTLGRGLLWKRVSENETADLASAAAQADLIVAAVGLTADLEGEEMKVQVEGFSGGDKTSLDLPADQRKLLEQAKATGKPLVVVVFNGSPIDLSWARENASAIIEAWYPGQSGGLAVANIIAGKTNPAGRLPLTFYRSVADLPPFADYSMTGRTYRYFTGTPVYPFGYGLSYSSFEYAPLEIEPLRGNTADGVRVSTKVTNARRPTGEEVAELYLTHPNSRVRRESHCADSSVSRYVPEKVAG